VTTGHLPNFKREAERQWIIPFHCGTLWTSSPPPDWVFGAEHCLIFPDPIKICFLANHKSFLESWHFDHALDDAMIRLKQILA